MLQIMVGFIDDDGNDDNNNFEQLLTNPRYAWHNINWAYRVLMQNKLR